MQIILFILIFFFSVFAQGKINIAVNDLEGHGVSSEEASTLSDKLRSILLLTGKYEVIERNEMSEILKEQGFQQSGCTK